MAQKRYYWLKLKEDFFNDDAISWLEEQKNGKAYCLFYLKLCLKSLRSNGVLIRQIGDMLIPYDVAKLAEMTHVDVDTVVVAMELLQKIKLIEVLDNGEIYMSQLSRMVGSESDKAESMRLLREKRKEMENSSEWEKKAVTMLPFSSNIVTQEIELEKEKEKELKQQPIERNHSISRRKNTLNNEICQGDLSTDLKELSTNLSIKQRKYLLDNFNKKDIEEKYVIFLQQKNIRNAYSWFLAALQKDFKLKNISKTVNSNCNKCHGTGSYACRVGESGEIISVVCDCLRNG